MAACLARADLEDTGEGFGARGPLVEPGTAGGVAGRRGAGIALGHATSGTLRGGVK